MDSSCENCMRWWDHHDRNCTSKEKMRFHVVVGEDFRSYLRVPQEFGSHLRNIISDKIKLNAPNGCIYDIEICREMGQIVLRSGWDVFATAHNLEQNDYLVFKFCGNSSFKVQIYNSCGGSQKMTSCVNPHPEMPYPEHVQTAAGFDYFTSGGSRLTKAQDNKVLEIAHTIKSKIPLYVAVMNKTNVDLNCCFIRIPSILMKDVLEKVLEATVKLEAPDASVYSVSAIQQDSDEIVLKSGWDNFVAAHHVQERDLIIFRCKGNGRLEVFILDPSGHLKTSNTQEMLDDSVKIVDPPHKAVDIIDLSSSSDDEDNVAAYSAKSARHQKLQSGNFAKARRMAATSCPSIESEHNRFPLNSNNSEGPTELPYIISNKLTLSRAQEKMVLEKVKAIRSRFSIYVAAIKRSSCVERKKHSKMCIAVDYARRYLPSTTHDLVLQLEGCQSKQWHTVLNIQGGYSRARGMWRIASGWAEFVSDNHLCLGDICLFELVETRRRLRMKVHLIRKTGAHI